MTVLQIQMMLHYHAICEPYAAHNPQHASSPAVIEQRRWLLDNDMLAIDNTFGSGYRPTRRGAFFVQYLQRLPLPESYWTMPELSVLE